jgi:hypothetical protein
MSLDVEPKDPSEKHFYISIAKSIIRIFAGGLLCYGFLAHAGGLLIIAEILGILEEL